LGLVLCGCRPAASAAVDPEPFKTAIVQYLQDHQMGLRIAEVRSLQVKDGKAEATVSLEHAEGMVGVKVRWTFDFEQRQGRWVAVRHQQ